jgi:hypothetical protein
MKTRLTAVFLLLLFTASLIAASVSAESYLYVEERLALVQKKIDAGAARGSLTKSEEGRLKTRYFVLKHKSDRYKKKGTTESQYLQLERDLTALEKDTDRLLNSLKRR